MNRALGVLASPGNHSSLKGGDCDVAQGTNEERSLYRYTAESRGISRRISGAYFPVRTPLIWFAISVLMQTGCTRENSRIQTLQQENAQLRRALQELQERLAITSGRQALNLDAKVPEPDLKLTVNELWSQRFDDQKFRAKQRLDRKIIRVSGTIGRITPTLITIAGQEGDMEDVSLTIALDGIYSAKIREGLATLEQGMAVIAQGRFVFDKLWLSDAVLIDKVSGIPLSTEKIKHFSSQEAGDGAQISRM